MAVSETLWVAHETLWVALAPASAQSPPGTTLER